MLKSLGLLIWTHSDSNQLFHCKMYLHSPNIWHNPWTNKRALRLNAIINNKRQPKQKQKKKGGGQKRKKKEKKTQIKNKTPHKNTNTKPKSHWTVQHVTENTKICHWPTCTARTPLKQGVYSGAPDGWPIFP